MSRMLRQIVVVVLGCSLAPPAAASPSGAGLDVSPAAVAPSTATAPASRPASATTPVPATAPALPTTPAPATAPPLATTLAPAPAPATAPPAGWSPTPTPAIAPVNRAPPRPVAAPIVARPYYGPTPLPAPAVVAPAGLPPPARSSKKTVMAASWGGLGLVYAVTAIVGAAVHDGRRRCSDPERCRQAGVGLMIPVVGPFMALGPVKNDLGELGAGLSGVIQSLALIQAVVSTISFAGDRRRTGSRAQRTTRRLRLDPAGITYRF